MYRPSKKYQSLYTVPLTTTDLYYHIYLWLICVPVPPSGRPVWRRLSCCTWTPGRSSSLPSASSGPTPSSGLMSRRMHSGKVPIHPGIQIQIRIGPESIRSVEPDPDPYSESGSRSRTPKITHKSEKNFMFWSAGCFSFVTWTSFIEAWR